ncbi:glycosyltransferase [Viscerimonas tarda]
MATYNGTKYIKEQVESILCQLSDDDELIISDDASTDNTIAILSELKDSRIKIYNFQRNKKGLSNHILTTSNFENALKQAKGEFIFLSDQDDIWDANKLKIFLENFEGNDLVVSDCCYIIDDEIRHNTSFCNGKSPKRNCLITRPSYHGCCIAFRKSLLNIAFPFPPKLPLHDAWLGMLAENVGKVKFVDEKLTYYRIHNSNVSVGKKNSYSYMVYYRLYIYVHLLFRLFTKGLCFVKNNRI